MTDNSERSQIPTTSNDVTELAWRIVNSATSTGAPANAQLVNRLLIDALRGALQSSVETTASRPPDGYAYRYPDGTGGVIRFNHGQEVNGYRPLEALPYWLGPAPPTKFPKQPKDCRHDLAMLKCSECGIDFSRVSVSSSPEKAGENSSG